jgi:tripartite-type tricarboxylate transporter receptor subunit TctC
MLKLCILITLTLYSLTTAFAQTPFYEGKTITIVQGREPGDAGDMRVKATLPFIQKYIPGNPTIISEYMPGGGGRKAANYIYRNAKPDGLTIGNNGAGFISSAIMGETGVQYDIDRFVYLGTPYSAAHYLITNRQLQLGNLEKLRAAPGIRIGAQSVGHTIYITGRLFAWMLGLKEPKFITAYAGNEIDVALMRGELDARSQAADWMLHRNRDWFEKRLIDVHAVFEMPKGDKHPQFPSVPEVETFARSDKERKVLAMQRGLRQAGSPYVLPPGTPKERVEIMRTAMRKTFEDPAFHADFKKFAGEQATPISAEEEKVVRAIPRDSDIRELFKAISGDGPLPGR